MNSAEFWKQFYESHELTLEPSGFAEYVAEIAPKASRIIDLGCGNGRDSLFFANRGFKVLALDQVQAPGFVHHDNVEFKILDFRYINDIVLSKNDLIYARFLFHAIPDEVLHSILNWARGKLFAEFRAFGDVPTIYPDHERVFWKAESFLELLEKYNFKVIKFDAAKNRAVYLNEDPLVFRLEAERVG